MSSMLDISEKSYRERKFPELFAQKNFTKNSCLYIKDDEVSPYHFNYDTIINMIKDNLVNTQKKIFISNAPLINA